METKLEHLQTYAKAMLNVFFPSTFRWKIALGSDGELPKIGLFFPNDYQITLNHLQI